jgi:hypothetical protein
VSDVVCVFAEPVGRRAGAVEALPLCLLPAQPRNNTTRKKKKRNNKRARHPVAHHPLALGGLPGSPSPSRITLPVYLCQGPGAGSTSRRARRRRRSTRTPTATTTSKGRCWLSPSPTWCAYHETSVICEVKQQTGVTRGRHPSLLVLSAEGVSTVGAARASYAFDCSRGCSFRCDAADAVDVCAFMCASVRPSVRACVCACVCARAFGAPAAAIAAAIMCHCRYRPRHRHPPPLLLVLLPSDWCWCVCVLWAVGCSGRSHFVAVGTSSRQR